MLQKFTPNKDVRGNGDLFVELKLNLTYSSQPAAANIDLPDFTVKKNVYHFIVSAQHYLTNNLFHIKTPVKIKTPVGRQKQIDIAATPAASLTSNKSARISATVSKKHRESRHVQTDEMNTETMKKV